MRLPVTNSLVCFLFSVIVHKGAVGVDYGPVAAFAPTTFIWCDKNNYLSLDYGVFVMVEVDNFTTSKSPTPFGYSSSAGGVEVTYNDGVTYIAPGTIGGTSASGESGSITIAPASNNTENQCASGTINVAVVNILYPVP
mmetsp:Transcript_2972/g.4135  ORF Transcript_2972/g.4135 Transcript_2972/m.4135 type:complete len:139 (-) Transcript_2972:319-735(-)